MAVRDERFKVVPLDQEQWGCLRNKTCWSAFPDPTLSLIRSDQTAVTATVSYHKQQNHSEEASQRSYVQTRACLDPSHQCSQPRFQEFKVTTGLLVYTCNYSIQEAEARRSLQEAWST